MTPQASERLIVALDSANVAEAQRLVDQLDDTVQFYKVGLVMQLAEGTDGFVRSLIACGKKVFLDYKYYDVPETIRKAVGRAAGTGVSFLTIHGSSRIIRAAVEAKGDSDLKLMTVTVLTSMDSIDMQEMGYSNHTPEELVLFRARKALEAGCDGVIASGREAEKIRGLSGGKLLVVTPGIRPEGYPEDDQKRTVTAGQAILAGADYLVVGRPITGDPDPRARAKDLIEEMQAAFDKIEVASR
jgi:orotidine-5'-phosphate decarboxylase